MKAEEGGGRTKAESEGGDIKAEEGGGLPTAHETERFFRNSSFPWSNLRGELRNRA